MGDIDPNFEPIDGVEIAFSPRLVSAGTTAPSETGVVDIETFICGYEGEDPKSAMVKLETLASQNGGTLVVADWIPASKAVMGTIHRPHRRLH